MAVDIRHYTVTIPAGTAIASPVTVPITMPPRIVTQIDWRVPNGPMGVMGWQIAMGGLQVFPNAGDVWVLANDERGSWPVTDAPDSGAWQVIGYNTGANPHSVYLAFHCELPERPKPSAAPIPLTALYPAPDLSRLGPPVARRM